MRQFVFGLLFLFLLVEGTTRIWGNNVFSLANFLLSDVARLGSWYPMSPDPQLGWAPSEAQPAGKNVQILRYGIRSNGDGNKEVPAHAILAVGDSFTFGSQVIDEDTWPARLQQHVGAPVLNAGVPGYGVDQSYLRAKQLVRIVKPKTILFSLIPNDIIRAEHSIWNGASRPYFEWNEKAPRLLNVPVRPPDTSTFNPNLAQRIFGYSLAIHMTLRRIIPHIWMAGVKPEWTHKRAHEKGGAVSCWLLAELDEQARREKMKLLVVLQYGASTSSKEIMLAHDLVECLAHHHVSFLDLRLSLQRIKKSDPERYKRFFSGHMTREGNDWVALQISERLKTDRL